jgi:hypothetical protein
VFLSSRTLLGRMMHPGQSPDAPRPGPPPGGAADALVRASRRGPTGARSALLALLAAAVASALLGLLAGLVWSALAPRALLVVQSRGVAYVVNPETSAFIVADAWFCLLTALGGLICGLAGYFLLVRRYGAPALVGLVLGGVAAALLTMWVGQQQGLAGFRATLAVSRAGALLREPLSLGGRGPLALWVLFAAAIVGGIEMSAQSRERRNAVLAKAPPPAVSPPPWPPGEELS